MTNSDSELDEASSRIIGSFSPIDWSRQYRGRVWHYTDAHGLNGIVQNGELFATSAAMLNDPQELLYGTKRIADWYSDNRDVQGGTPQIHAVLLQVLKTLTRSIAETPAYVVCASENLLLSQWRNYANSTGYAVQLDTASSSFGVLDDAEFDESGRQKPEASGLPMDRLTALPAWTRVLYEPSEQEELIRQLFAEILTSGQIERLATTDDFENAGTLVRGHLSALAASMKHPDYREECEVRLISYLHERRRPQHRSGARGVIPFVKIIAIPDELSNTSRRKGVLPITAVQVGPPSGETQEQRQLGARSLLASHGYSPDIVMNSPIPFLP